MVKECLLILKKTSLIDASSAFLSDDDFVKNEALVTSSPGIKEAKKVKVIEVAKA